MGALSGSCRLLTFVKLIFLRKRIFKFKNYIDDADDLTENLLTTFQKTLTWHHIDPIPHYEKGKT